MNKYLKRYKKELNLTHSKKEAVLKWIKKLEKGELKEEVANYINFSHIILEDILGYDYEEDILSNVKEDYGRGLSEFALKKDGKKFLVIELKGSDTDLDKPQHRVNDKRTPVDQAFDYAKRSGDIDWIMVSNYNKFRLYNWHKKQHQYISFHIGELKDPETFKAFMLVFSKFSIEHNLIEKLVSKTIFVERDLEAEFYKLYNETRLMLIAELEHIHPEFTRDESVHYAQLILNRYIFICFAEDLGLLPGQITLETIENPVKNKNIGRSDIWHGLNGLFLDVNEGNDFKKIYGYNGGLFTEDLEFLKVRDIVEDRSIFRDAYQKWKFEEYSLIVEEKLGPYSGKINPIYKNLMTVSSFNFSTDVDVNILGHIFENSIGEIEELKADQKGRRKKEGIFYTPEYITDYICRNTIIPYLSKSGKANTIDDLIGEFWGSEIDELEENVRKIKIVDPACGSGAFLNKASDVLLEIHQAMHEQRYKEDKSLIPFIDNIEERRKILLDNIFGVDLNEESVEITKLSLFLKVCKEGLKLPNLDNNIKCGNSLIDDPRYTDKPFNWEENFKKIFEDGGFDIVIGNPPYVRMEKIKDIKPFLKRNYVTYSGRSDLYVYFFEKGLNVLKDNGMFSFICSDKFIKAKYGKALRNFILDYSFLKYVNYTTDHTGKKVFEDTTTYPCVTVIKKTHPKSDSKIVVNESFEILQSKLDSHTWNLEPSHILDLKEKVYSSSIRLKEIPSLKIRYGVKTGYNKAFIIDDEIKNTLIKQDFKNNEVIKPVVRGRDINAWGINYQNIHIVVIKFGDGIDLESNFPTIYTYLRKYEKNLKNRGQVKNGQHHWLELDNNPSLEYFAEFEKEKIVWSEIVSEPKFTFDDTGLYPEATTFFLTTSGIDLKYLTALLNSKLLFWIFKDICTELRGGYVRYKKVFIEQLPIYLAMSESQKPIIEKADRMLKLNKDLFDEINGFKDWLTLTFKIEKFSKKLDKYYELSFNDLLTELKKKKVDIKHRKDQELLKKEFESSLDNIIPLLHEIDATKNEIDHIIYRLYGLNDYEIEIVENSLKYD